MEETSLLLPIRSFTVTPRGSGRSYTVEVRDRAGAPLATCDREGTLRDRHGVLFRAPLCWRGKAARATDAGIDVADATGRPLWVGRVVGYGFGPGARKITVAVVDPAGRDVARLEPRDRKGQQLALHAAGSDIAAVSVAQVRSGFLRSSRVYTVNSTATIPDELRWLVLALTVRYDALLNAAQSAEQPD